MYLAMEDSKKLIIESIELSWLDSKKSEDLEKTLKVYFLRGYLQSRIKVILVVGIEQSRVNSKQQCYLNRLANLLGVKQLEL